MARFLVHVQVIELTSKASLTVTCRHVERSDPVSYGTRRHGLKASL
jgi:hypothetical protein